MKKIIVIFFVFFTILYAKESVIHINKLDELEILKSIDINPSFINDSKYKSMKDNINELKTMYFLKALKNGSIFMPNLHELLGESNIPDTFLYMAMVESKFRADVKSNRNAAGLWQIMPKTAKRFKLEVNRNIDERLDPIKSTKAAIKYLQYLHGRFGKWYLAAIAYNCGETKLSRVLKKTNSDELEVLIDDKKKYLPPETRNYIRRIIIAALLAHNDEIIAKNNADHLFGSCTNSKLIEVFFNGGMTLRSIARRVGMTVKKIKTCNPHLLRSRLPANKKTYHIYLPQEHIADLDDSSTNISIGRFTYTVKKGDTLFLISKRFNNKISAIKRLNPKLKKYLSVGKRITLIGHNKNQLIAKKSVTTKKNKKNIDIKNLPLAQTVTDVKNLPSAKTKEEIENLPLAQTVTNIENIPLAKTKEEINNLPLAKTISNTDNSSKNETVSSGELFTYFVKESDSVYSISLKFDNQISTLEKLNPGFLDNFKEGMALKIRK